MRFYVPRKHKTLLQIIHHVGLLLAQRRRRWTNINTTLGQRFVLAVQLRHNLCGINYYVSSVIHTQLCFNNLEHYNVMGGTNLHKGRAK